MTHSATPAGGPVQIDVGAVLRSRLGARGRYVPRWLVKPLERLICQDRLNDLLRYGWPRRGADFCRAVTERLGITVLVNNPGNFPSADASHTMFVCNHPLGGLDGMVLIDVVQRLTGKEPYFVVNDLLMAVEPLADVFVPVNKHGAQSKHALAALDEALASDRPVIVFPAGLCSRRRNGRVADLEWKKMFVQKSRRYGRDIVPLHFEAANSPRFYRTASLRGRLRIPFNLEMVLLPSEIFRNTGAMFTITAGDTIQCGSGCPDPREEAARIRDIVYSLAPSQAEKSEKR